MADLIFLATGAASFVAFAALAAALRRVWRWSSASCGGPGRWSSRSIWSPPCCGPSGS